MFITRTKVRLRRSLLEELSRVGQEEGGGIDYTYGNSCCDVKKPPRIVRLLNRNKIRVGIRMTVRIRVRVKV